MYSACPLNFRQLYPSMKTKTIAKYIIGLLLAAFLIFGISPKLVSLNIHDLAVTNVINLIPPESADQLRVSEKYFDAGWFASEGELDMVISPLGSASESFTVPLRLSIQHGPLLFTEDGPKLGLAFVQIYPEIDDSITQVLAELPFDLPSMQIDLLAGFDNSLDIGLSVDAVDYSGNEGLLSFGGLQANFIAYADQSAEFSLEIARIEAAGAASNTGFVMERLDLVTSTSQMTEILAPSSAALSIPSLSSSGPLPFQVHGISTDSKISASAAGPNRTDIYQGFHIDSLETDIPLTSLAWTLEVNEIQNDLFLRYYELLAELQGQLSTNAGTVNTRVSELGQELALILIQNSMAVSNLLEASAYGGDHNLDFRMDWQGLPDLDEFVRLDLNEAIAALNVSLELSLDLEAVMRSPAADLVDPYVQQGYITLANGRILATGSVSNNQLELNGDILPLDELF